MKKLLILLFVLSGCAVTYETPKCELILRGEPCLSDHRCCNPPQTYYQTHTNWHWWYWSKPNKTIIINKPNNKPNKPNRPNRPNNRPNKKKR